MKIIEILALRARTPRTPRTPPRTIASGSRTRVRTLGLGSEKEGGAFLPHNTQTLRFAISFSRCRFRASASCTIFGPPESTTRSARFVRAIALEMFEAPIRPRLKFMMLERQKNTRMQSVPYLCLCGVKYSRVHSSVSVG